MMTNDFLSQFHKNAFHATDVQKGRGSSGKVLFRLSFTDGANRLSTPAATVAVVNGKGDIVQADYKQYQGETFNVLRIIDNIQKEQAMRISWDTAEDQSIRLHDYPYLLFALLRCDNLVDDSLKPLKVSQEPATIVLKITKNESGQQYIPSLLARAEGQQPQAFELLSDVFALIGDTICPIASLGENYLRIGFFNEMFPCTLVEQYLSVFYSYINNVDLDFEDYTLVRSEQTVSTVPTIIIEKVDADMALYLRLIYTLPGTDSDFAQRFDLTCLATLTMERQVLLRRIVHSDVAGDEEELRKTIIGCAPTKTMAKDVWNSDGEFIIPQDVAGPFLLQALPKLVLHYQLLGAERLKEYKVKPIVPKMNLKLSSGINFLEGTASIDIDGAEMSLRSFLQQYNKQKYVTLSDGQRGLVDEHYVKRLERIFRKVEKGDKAKVSFFDLPEIEDLLNEKLEGQTFKHYREFYEGFNQLASKRLTTTGVNAKLRNYQKEGVKWIQYLYDNNFGGCLADDMGLGKTLQAITMLTKVYRKPTAPLSSPEGDTLAGKPALKSNEAPLSSPEGDTLAGKPALKSNEAPPSSPEGDTLAGKPAHKSNEAPLSSPEGDTLAGKPALKSNEAPSGAVGGASGSLGASLIVMPRSLLFNWQDELKKFAPQLTYYTYYGAQRNLEEAMKQQLILTTYALVRNDIEQFRQQHFHYIILDESQNIKNLQSQTTQAIFLLNGAHRLALSGTPIENNLTELYSLYRFLNPAMLGTAEDFNRQYATPIQHQADKEATESLRRKIFPFMLRRLKKDVLKELPDRTEQTLYVEMEPSHAQFYEERRSYYEQAIQSSIKAQGLEKSQMMMFQALSELRRIASVPESLSDGAIASPKIPLLCEQVEEAVAGGHKVVIFFNFIAGIELVGERLTELGIDYTTMTGSTRDRRAVIERFQNDSGCRALLMTLKTGGVGLNLTVADTVYIFEPWWNKAAEEQAINRLHRIGQKAKVLSFALITRDTIEEKIRLLQQQKQDLADSLITGDAAITKRLTEEDIKYIFGQ
ncbi:MAG: DEAD/DEAH box helicase [Prevotella sp.]|nr:DEAD/DEAH box helicase [Prevotella sp.]